MVTRTEVDRYWQDRLGELKLLSKYEREVALALLKFTPPPREVKARPPVVRKAVRCAP